MGCRSIDQTDPPPAALTRHGLQTTDCQTTELAGDGGERKLSGFCRLSSASLLSVFRVLLCSWLDHDSGADRQEIVQFVDILIEERDTALRPVHPMLIEILVLGDVYADLAADAGQLPGVHRHQTAVPAP